MKEERARGRQKILPNHEPPTRSMLDLSAIPATHNHIHIAPLTVPCARCRQHVQRHEVRTRSFWTPGDSPTITHLHFGYYICPSCPARKRAFSALPPEYRTASQYDLPTQDLVISAVVDLNASHCAAASWARRRLGLRHLQDTTITRWLQERAGGIDETAHRKKLLENFSGQMCVDELYDGRFCVLRVTDPLNNTEIAFRLIEGPPNHEHIRELFTKLKAEGYRPMIVNTDGSNLYPAILAEVWPKAAHQRCVFHFLMALFKLLGSMFWAAYKTMPKPPKRKRGRPKKRGRPRKDKVKKANREAVRAVRWLILKNPCSLSDKQAEMVAYAIHLCPPLKHLRRLACALMEMFGPNTDTTDKAEEKRAAICADEAFQALDKSVTLLKKLEDIDLFGKLTAYLFFENAVKTTNHVERENRAHRHRQKVRFSYRTERSLRALLTIIHHRKRPSTYRDGKPRKVIRLVRRRPTDNGLMKEVNQVA